MYLYLRAYLSLVRSTLEYSSIVWDPHLQKDIDKLERVQRQAARFITGDYTSRDQGRVSRMLVDLVTIATGQKEDQPASVPLQGGRGECASAAVS